LGKNPGDQEPFTILISIDSSSAIAMSESHSRDTKQTHNIAHQYHLAGSEVNSQ
jgi:hypothetical protein